MPTKLSYPPLPEGYRWNLLNKINMKIGKWPGTSTTGNATYLNFIEDLTPQEITDVDTIVGDGSTCQDPVVGVIADNHYVLKDIWEWRGELETATGINFALTYRSSGTFGPNVYDEIIVQPVDPTYQTERDLTNPEKNTVAVTIRSQMGDWE